MSSSVRKLNFSVAVGTFGGNVNKVNGISIRDDGRSTPTNGLYPQSNQCNPLKLNMSYATTGNLDEKPSPASTNAGGNGPGSIISIGLSNSLSVISPLIKDSNSGQVSGLRHRVNLGQKIEKHLLKAEELRKISKGFNISSRNAVKRWFVLYDDSHKPIGGGDNSQNHTNYPPPPTHHDIILDASGSPASAIVDQPYYLPAHLEYHDNEKKWRAGAAPNKDIILKDCFNICRKLDGAGIKDHVIAVVSIKDTLDIIFEKEQDMLIWLELLLSCQQGGRSAQGRIAKPIYENMWEVNVKGFKSDKGSTSKFFQITGPHRLVATDEAFKFFELGSEEAIPFAYKDIKGHKNHNRNYIIQTGRMTRSGRGEIEIDCKDHHVAAQIYATFERLTKETIPDKTHSKSSGHHGHFRQNSNSSRSSRSRDSVQGNLLQHGKSIAVSTVGGYRPRSESWSNPSISHSLTNSKVGVLPGHPGLTESSIQSSDKEEKQSTPQIISKSSEITIGGKLSKLGNMRPKKDLRYRTTSEGNHFGNITSLKNRGAKNSITSGSPMSPGSYISSERESESAGSSNSIDETEIPYGTSMTPLADHTQEATIFEESSAESWVDPHDLKSIEEHIIREEVHNKQKPLQENDAPHNSMIRQLGMSSLLLDGRNTTLHQNQSRIIKESSIDLGQFPGSCDSFNIKFVPSTQHSSMLNGVRNEREDLDVVDSGESSVSYAQLCLDRSSNNTREDYRSTGPTDFLPENHPSLVGVPIPRYQTAFNRGNVEGDLQIGSASSPSQTHYATIMSVNDLSSINNPSTPINLITPCSKKPASTDLTIATSPINAGSSSDYMLMSPPPPMATPPVPTTVNYASLAVANNNNNSNLSSMAINLASITPTVPTNNFSGSSSSTSSLKRQTSMGNGSNCGGARSNISTLERERRKLSMLGLDEGQITSMLMTSSLTGSVSNPRDPSSSLITSPSSQSSYNPLSDGGGIDKEYGTGADEEASIYTLMSPTGVSASISNHVPIPGASSPNVSNALRQASQSFQHNKTSSISSLTRRSGRRSVGSNDKDIVSDVDFANSNVLQLQDTPNEQVDNNPYVHMSPSAVASSSNNYKETNVNIHDGSRNTARDDITPSGVHDIDQTSKTCKEQDKISIAQSQNGEEPISQFGSRRGSKSSLSHLGSSPSAALTSHLAGPLLPLYTDTSNSLATAPSTNQGDDSSPYLLMSPASAEDKSILRDDCDSLSGVSLTAALRGYPSNPIYTGTRTRNRNRVSNSESKRSSMCSDAGLGNVSMSGSALVGPSGSSTNVNTAEWLGGQMDGKCGSRNSSLAGTPMGSLPAYNISSSLHRYKSSTENFARESDLSKQMCSEKDNLPLHNPDDVYVPLNFGDDDASGNHTMPLQDHEIALSLARRSTSSTSGNIQIPTNRQSHHRNALPRMSPASSGSMISGTPNSFKGMDSFSTQPSEQFAKMVNDNDDGASLSSKRDRSQNSDSSKPVALHGGRAFSLSSSNRPSTVSSSNSSIGSTLGQSLRQHGGVDIPGGKTSETTLGKSAIPINSGASPNTMAARLGSWFRTRAGSVPARPNYSGRRRHRTQSEGEKNINSSKLPENQAPE